MQRAQSVHFVVDDGVLAPSDERPPEVVVRERLLLARQRDSALLDVVEHHAHLVDGSCFNFHTAGSDTSRSASSSTADGDLLPQKVLLKMDARRPGDGKRSYLFLCCPLSADWITAPCSPWPGSEAECGPAFSGEDIRHAE